MKKQLLLVLVVFIIILVFPSHSWALWMMGGDTSTVAESDGHTAREEAEGKIVWEQLQAKTVSCDELADEDFGALGEYYMGQMMGDDHEAMNNQLIQMLGEEGEEQMHIAMGKRMSGCEPNAPMPLGMTSGGMMPMMNMMTGFDGMKGGGNSMMGSYGTNPMGVSGWGFGWIFMILFWGLAIVGIIALFKWMTNQGKSQIPGKSAVEILKERYAKGEIDKKEFEVKKSDLV